MKLPTTDVPTVIGFLAALAIVWLPNGIVDAGRQAHHGSTHAIEQAAR